PWPGAYTFYKEQRWKILKARVVEEERSALGGLGRPGQVVKVEKQGAQVSTGRGILALEELQPAGGRRMIFQEYLAGHPVEEGIILQ
ncbi:MAG TPA: methionyl-tRNA formyltransferase, partial [Nitrospiria bacterium]|nr:methionyl-tRNA formyltransferase [Nitrospiria bacterium]